MSKVHVFMLEIIVIPPSSNLCWALSKSLTNAEPLGFIPGFSGVVMTKNNSFGEKKNSMG